MWECWVVVSLLFNLMGGTFGDRSAIHNSTYSKTITEVFHVNSFVTRNDRKRKTKSIIKM